VLGLDMEVLRPASRSVDCASSVSGTASTLPWHLVASGVAGHTCQYQVLSGHMQLRNPASHSSRFQPHHHHPSSLTTLSEYPPSLRRVWGPALGWGRSISDPRKYSSSTRWESYHQLNVIFMLRTPCHPGTQSSIFRTLSVIKWKCQLTQVWKQVIAIRLSSLG